MHEWGITESIVGEIIRQASENGLKKVNKVERTINKKASWGRFPTEMVGIVRKE